MDWKIAIEKIQDNHCANCEYGDPNYCSSCLEESNCPYLFALNALSSQIPRRYLYSNENRLCPNCVNLINERYHNYCPECGQKIDWRK